jgi:phage terminase small subunit
MPRQLTAKQNKFIDGVLSGLSNTEAYRQAYDCKNMKPETIHNKAYALSIEGEIRARIEEGRKEIENEQLWTRKDALTELAKIGKADIKDYLQYKTAKAVVSRDKITGEPVIDYTQIVDLMDSQDVDGRVIQEISISKDGTLKFKLHDKLKAIELANKMCGYNEPDKVDAAIQIVLGEELQEWGK